MGPEISHHDPSQSLWQKGIERFPKEGGKKREKIELVAAAKQGFVPHGAFAAQRANALCGTIRAITFLFSFPESLSQVGKKKERKKKAQIFMWRSTGKK